MGGRGKGGGGGHTPIEQPNTLESAQKLKIIDLLCEGVAGQDVTFKNIYLDNTPVQNEDGSYNFTGIRVSALPGTHNQDYLAGFDSTDKIVSVGAEVKASKPITRTITDPLVDSVRVTLALGSLVTLKDNGDRVGGSVSLTVKCGNKNYPVTITGKTTSAYHQDVVLTDLPDTPFNISVHRNTPDSNTDSVSNATHWVSYVESIDAKFNYPNSVVVGLEIDSAQFGGKIPTRTYLNKWTQIKVPNNYDPITRTYDGIWLGEFKTAWSNNPAWVFYDLATDKRYGLGDRLGEFGCDKWSLYQIAKFCDQIVPDGFGGEEPRFTCNAYISEPSDAKALLDDLASVFRGIAVWDGQQVMALQDAKKDPVATYTNANVADGLFGYQGAGQKTIFTAAHVKYNDKTDGYATKTEYVANDDAIKRYGLNVKQITAFGCTSRGQAARVGKWLIETSISEQQMVSFKVGREGIRHLPFDIIEIADNDYAGDMIAGRVRSVTGKTITTDRKMSDIRSIRYYANGQSKTVAVQSVAGTKITLADIPVGIEQLGVFNATKTDVKPRLFRALSIKEDGDTYTISAVQHDANKEAVVDQGVTFEQDKTATKHKPQVSYGRVSKDGDELLIAWEGTNTTEYLIKIYKDGELYRTYTQDSAEIKLKGLPNGEYKAEIRGKSANGQLTEPVIKEWSIDYDIKGLKATPELFAIKLDWTNPTTVINKAKIEIYRSLSNNRATATKVATLSYPTDTFTQNGVKLSETHYFWLRLIDDQGNTGDWVTVSGKCSDDTSQIVASINGKITQTELSKTLINSLQSDINTAKTQAISSANADAANKVADEATARAQALQAEVTARSNAIQAEAEARTHAIQIEAQKQTDALINKATELGTQISNVENVNNQQAQHLGTLTAKHGELTSGLEEERTARIEGDQAEASARQALASNVGTNTSAISRIDKAVTDTNESIAQTRTDLTSEFKATIKDNIKSQYIDIGDLVRGEYWNHTSGSILKAGNHVRSGLIDANPDAYYKLLPVNKKTGQIGYVRVIFLDKNDNFINGKVFGDSNYDEITVKTPSQTARLAFSYDKDNLESYDDVMLQYDVTEDINNTKASLDEFKQTQANKDQAQTTNLNQAVSRIGKAEGSITSLQSTKASKTEVASLARTALSSEWQGYAELQVANLEIGGRNLVHDSARKVFSGTGSRAEYTPWGNIQYALEKVNVGDTITISFDIEMVKGNFIQVYCDNLRGKVFFDPKKEFRNIGTKKQRLSFDTKVVSGTGIGPTNLEFYSNYGSADWYTISNVKIEKGNKAIDWTPAPEDVDSAINATQASIDEFKQTQATKDQAQTIATNQALSRIGTAESNITTLQKTSVTKDKAQSTHTIKTQAIAGGKRAIAGIAVGAMASEQTAESQVIVMADNFGVVRDAGDGVVKPMFSLVNNQAVFNGDLIADGTILGKHIKANQTISAPIINGGELNINDRFIVDKYGNLTGKSGRFEGDVVLKNGQVDTLHIAGEAVVVPRVQFTATTETVRRTVNVEVEINSVTLDAKGGAVSINFGFERLVVSDFGSQATVVIRLKRDDVILREINFPDVYNQLDYKYINIPSFLDKPPEGEHKYSVTMTGISYRERAITTSITARTLHVMAVKR